MKIDIVTIFPRMVEAPLAEGIVARAIARGIVDARVHDLRNFTTDRHRVVDDVPFGGGPGMVLKPEPLFAAGGWIRAHRGAPSAVILTSPRGERLTRPAEFRGYEVPAVLLSGHHAEIERWRRRQALERTIQRRPDLLVDAALAP